MSEPLRVAIVGAGISGLTCARTLHDLGHDVVVVDKARGLGGRTSTRRGDGTSFDHGAQFLTVRDPDFDQQVRSWIQDGVVAEWQGRVVALGDSRADPSSRRRLVGVPGMSSITRHLAAGLRVLSESRVMSIDGTSDTWTLQLEGGRAVPGSFDVVVVAVPGPQAAPLLAPAPALAAAAARSSYGACIALMVACSAQLQLDYDGAQIDDDVLSWIARDSSKPGRPDGERWVLHAGPVWSDAHFDSADPSGPMLEAFARLTGVSIAADSGCEAHRWRYALPADAAVGPCLLDSHQGIGACGDWLVGPRVEGAYLSGAALARRVADAAAELGRTRLR